MLDETSATTTTSDVLGGHRCVIQPGPLYYNTQTLGFAAIQGRETGMVLSGHFQGLLGLQPMPLNVRVYSPTSYYPFRTNQIGYTHYVGGVYSDSSYMRPYYGGGRIKAGVEHYGSHMPVWGWEDPQVDDWVYQTGFQTGTTLGRVLDFVDVTCPIRGLLVDQAIASYNNAPGDSGSPVYWIEVIHYPIPNGWWPPDPEFTFLKGVDTGQITYQGVSRAVFSTMTQVTDDLDVWPLPGPF